jgi:hypothetical protein
MPVAGRSHMDANAEAAIRLMKQAAEVNVKCPNRKGAVVELRGPGEIMITGDVHGHKGNFQQIVKLANLPRNAQRHLVLQELVHQEDLPRNVPCSSYQVLEMSARLKVMFPQRVHVLMGNHEFAELNDLAIAKHGRELNEAFNEGLRRAYGGRWSDVKAAYKEFWRSQPLALDLPGGILVSHSTPTLTHMDGLTREYLTTLPPGEGLTRKSPAFYLLWGRDYSREAADRFAELMQARLFIVAHTPCESGYALPSHRHVLLDSSSEKGVYLLMALSANMSQEQIASRIRRISGALPVVEQKPAAI